MTSASPLDHNPSWANLTSSTWFTTKLWVPIDGCSTFTNQWLNLPRPLPSPLPPDLTSKNPRKRGPTTNKNGKDPKDTAARMMKTQIYPTPEQSKVLGQWCGVVRWTYNQCISYGKKSSTNPTPKELRDEFVCQEVIEDKPWLKVVPALIRNEGVRDYIKAVTSNEAKKLNPKNNLKHYEISFRSKKKLHQETLSIPGRYPYIYDSNPNEVHIDWPLFPGPLRLAESLPLQYFTPEQRRGNKKRCFYAVSIIREKTGKWFLALPLQLDHVFPQTLPVSHYRPPATPTNRRVVALDPGIKPFIACYSPQGEAFHIGTPDDSAKLEKIAWQVDSIQSRWTKEQAKKKRKLKKAARKRRRRHRNLQQEIHRKTAKLLVANYDDILIPSFETSKMTQHDERVLKSRSVRQLLTWSHYRFRQVLTAKARERPGVRVLVVSEAYTSKSCGQCGHIHDRLGGNKIFKCPECQFTIDRDLHGARNIFLRNMGYL